MSNIKKFEDFKSVNETFKKGELEKLEGQTVQYSIITNGGEVQVTLDDYVLRFTHNNETKLEKR